MKRKFSRRANHASSLVKNLATSLLLYERMRTTPTKARAAQIQAEKLITMAKRWMATDTVGGKLALYRRILAQTADELAAKKLIDVLAERFATRPGGYTRRIRLSRRQGDNAPQVVVTLTDLVHSAAKAAPAAEGQPAKLAQRTTKITNVAPASEANTARKAQD